ncbi:hypothetical protein PMIN07_005537 [Paraphaeosphaeria minitans]
MLSISTAHHAIHLPVFLPRYQSSLLTMLSISFSSYLDINLPSSLLTTTTTTTTTPTPSTVSVPMRTSYNPLADRNPLPPAPAPTHLTGPRPHPYDLSTAPPTPRSEPSRPLRDGSAAVAPGTVPRA